MNVLPDSVQRRHIVYFDFLRFIAMCSVIFMHTAAELLRTEVTLQWGLLNACTSFAFTAVPLFLMMSGYLLCAGEKTADVSVLLKKRLPRLLIPLVTWTVIAAFRICIAEQNLTVSAFCDLLIQSFASPIAVHFWYMYLMIALYVLSPLVYSALHHLSRQGHCYLLALIGLVTLHAMAAAVLPDRFDKWIAFDIFEKLKLYGGHFCTFLLGYYLGKMEQKIPNRILIPAAVFLWALITAATHVLTVRHGAYTPDFQNQSAGFEVALAACLFLLFKQNIRPAARFFAAPVVSLGLPVYLMHGVLLSVVHMHGLYPGNLLGTLAMTLGNLIVCYLFTKTIATIRPLCYLFTGMPYRAACKSCNWRYTWNRIRSAGQKSGAAQ